MESLRFARNVIIKTLALLVVINLVFALWYPLPQIGRVSAYNSLFPGRKRLPYGENPSRDYSLSLYNLEAMFASHELAGKPKAADEFRVILIGDSATWGFLLSPEGTLSASLNRANLQLPNGRQVKFYNLGYPVMSLTKDLLVLSYAMQFSPDLIVWPLTLESFPYDKQLFPPLLQNNPAAVRQLVETYHLNMKSQVANLKEPSFWDRTIAGSRRTLADIARLQIYGAMWAATGIDQDIPKTYTPRAEDLTADASFHDLQSPHLIETDLAFDVLAAGFQMASSVPVLIVNEPMFVSQGQNSHIRYNYFYPRWAYDDYRQMMQAKSQDNGWLYIDAWNIVDNNQFTNSAVHLTPAGNQQLADYLAPRIFELAIMALSQ